MKSPYCIFVWVIFVSTAVAGEITSDKNWQNHSELKKIRAIYDQVNGAEKIKKLEKQAKKCSSQSGTRELNQELYMDRNNLIRKYVVDGGSEDSRGRVEYYYDEGGRLRFTYRLHATVNGTHSEDRLYFDEKGRHLYTDHQEKGPDIGSTGFADVVTNPRSEFTRPCRAWNLSEAR